MPGGIHPRPSVPFDVPYRVDFTVESKGRHLDLTKRRLTWKFGFADPPSIFPHLYDDDGNYVGRAPPPSGATIDVDASDRANGDEGGGDRPNVDGDPPPSRHRRAERRGVDCRGREHEITLIWSLLTGKAHIYVDNRELYRCGPSDDGGGTTGGGVTSHLNPFAASFHRGFDLPDHRRNGRHRIDIRCYACTPFGARNMAVNDSGETFHRYDLTVDGLSYHSMPAVHELGTERMWERVRGWGMLDPGGGGVDRASNDTGFADRRPYGGPRGRLVDEYYFDRDAARRRADEIYRGNDVVGGGSISRSEHRAMTPRTESDEGRMVRIALEASLREWEGNRAAVAPPAPPRAPSGVDDGGGGIAEGKRANGLTTIGEDVNLIDFGDDNPDDVLAPKYVVSPDGPSDVSLMADDDSTTASFLPAAMPYQSYSAAAGVGGGVYHHPTPDQRRRQQQQQQQRGYPYQDPTFRPPPRQYQAQRPWSGVGTVSSTAPFASRDASATTFPSDASFAVPPPPTWDDYNNAFGRFSESSVAGGASVVGGGYAPTAFDPVMSPMSNGSVGVGSPVAQQRWQPPVAQQYGMQQAPRWQSQSFGPTAGGTGQAYVGGGPSASQTSTRGSNFDPLRADPFAS